MKKYFDLLRIRHYIKNLLVFAPILFTNKIYNIDQLFDISKVFILFCVLASIVYVFNDINDIKSDKKHPKKNKIRPLVNGLINLSQAKIIIFSLTLIACGLLYYSPKVIIISLVFIIINILYSKVFKKIIILDIFILSSNYVIRVFAGSIELDVNLSSWMAATIFCTALFLSSLKRKQELFLYGTKSREVLKDYSLNGLKKITDFSAILAIMFYCSYVITINEKLIFTMPLVLYGFFRYNYKSENKDFSDSPVDEILNDKQLLAIIFIWILSIIFTNSFI
jgi:decaprenyl-phosphate phosphoribosyltransferase